MDGQEVDCELTYMALVARVDGSGVFFSPPILFSLNIGLGTVKKKVKVIKMLRNIIL